MTIGLLLFCLFALALSLAPFLPAWREVLQSADAKPSEIRPNQAKDPREDPEQVFWFLVGRLGVDSLEALSSQLPKAPRAEPRVHPSGTCLLGPDAVVDTDSGQTHVLGCGRLRTSPGKSFGSKLVSLDDIDTSPGNRFIEIHARGMLRLARENQVFWWASAREIEVSEHCLLIGKLDAEARLWLRGSTRFHLLHAPLIVMGDLSSQMAGAAAHATSGSAVASPAPDVVLPRQVHSGDFELAAGAQVDGDLVVRGSLSVGEGAIVRGSVKARQGIVLGAQARVAGAVFATGPIEIGRGCMLGGPVGSEERIEVWGGAQVGTLAEPTSVVAREVLIREPCLFHGTVRAWQAGEVRWSAQKPTPALNPQSSSL